MAPLSHTDPIEAFLSGFVSAPSQTRFREIFSLPVRRWSRLTFHEFSAICLRSPRHIYTHSTRPVEAHPSHTPCLDPFSDFPLPFRSHLTKTVNIIATGHTVVAGGKIALLSDALLNNSLVFDGFISVVPGCLCIVLDHDDRLTFCEKRNVQPCAPMRVANSSVG